MRIPITTAEYAKPGNSYPIKYLLVFFALIVLLFMLAGAK